MMRAGIPTIRNHIRYRSRLEARWAAFFRLMKWETYYEPFDLNGWIPDFVLHGGLSGREQIPIEVKPVRDMDDQLFKETATKIARSGWKGERLIVSYFLPEINWSPKALAVGWLGEAHDMVDDGNGSYREIPTTDAWWERAPFQQVIGQSVTGFCHESGWYGDRVTGGYDGGHIGADCEEIERLWAQAGNEVQWLPR